MCFHFFEERCGKYIYFKIVLPTFDPKRINRDNDDDNDKKRREKKTSVK
jgi:hypothetical protein